MSRLFTLSFHIFNLVYAPRRIGLENDISSSTPILIFFLMLIFMFNRIKFKRLRLRNEDKRGDFRAYVCMKSKLQCQKQQ